MRFFHTLFVQGLHASMADRLGDWSFGNDVQSIILKPDTEIILPDRPAALRAALQQLRALDAPNAVVTFEGWGVFEPSDMEEWDASDPRWYNKACAWTEELERVMAEALPTLPHLKFVTPDVEVPREDFGMCFKYVYIRMRMFHTLCHMCSHPGLEALSAFLSMRLVPKLLYVCISMCACVCVCLCLCLCLHVCLRPFAPHRCPLPCCFVCLCLYACMRACS